MKFYNFIFESRKNPNLNPKTGIIDELIKYKDEPDVYISFTKLNKLGINPQAKNDTPIGIYAYPLKEIWNDLVNDEIPFASNPSITTTIQVFKIGSKYNIQDVSKYSKKQFENDIEKLKNLYPDRDFNNILKINAYTKNYAKKLFNIISNLTNNSPIKENKTLRYLGYDGFSDKTGLGIIHQNEPIQAFFTSIKPIKKIKTIHNKRRDNVIFVNNIDKFKELEKSNVINKFNINHFLVYKHELFNKNKIIYKMTPEILEYILQKYKNINNLLDISINIKKIPELENTLIRYLRNNPLNDEERKELLFKIKLMHNIGFPSKRVLELFGLYYFETNLYKIIELNSSDFIKSLEFQKEKIKKLNINNNEKIHVLKQTVFEINKLKGK